MHNSIIQNFSWLGFLIQWRLITLVWISVNIVNLMIFPPEALCSPSSVCWMSVCFTAEYSVPCFTMMVRVWRRSAGSGENLTVCPCQRSQVFPRPAALLIKRLQHTHTDKHSLSLTHTHTHTDKHALTHTHSLTLKHTHTHRQTCTHSHTHSLSHTHTLLC